MQTEPMSCRARLPRSRFWLLEVYQASFVSWRYIGFMHMVRALGWISSSVILLGTALAQVQITPLFELEGETSAPSLSPDGKTLVFDWCKPDYSCGIYTDRWPELTFVSSPEEIAARACRSRHVGLSLSTRFGPL